MCEKLCLVYSYYHYYYKMLRWCLITIGCHSILSMSVGSRWLIELFRTSVSLTIFIFSISIHFWRRRKSPLKLIFIFQLSVLCLIINFCFMHFEALFLSTEIIMINILSIDWVDSTVRLYFSQFCGLEIWGQGTRRAGFGWELSLWIADELSTFLLCLLLEEKVLASLPLLVRTLISWESTLMASSTPQNIITWG